MREHGQAGYINDVPPEGYAPTVDLWVYSHRLDTHEFHRVIAQNPLLDRAYQVIFHTACGANRRHAETSLEPPADLELCAVCALGDFDAWVVYRCFDKQNLPLYVGCTDDLVKRIRQHRGCKKLSYRWWPQVDRIDTDVFYNRDEALEAECAAIAALAPRFNTLHNRGRVMAA